MIISLLICHGMQSTVFNYRGSNENYTVHGIYKFELWGAQGGGGYDNGDLLSKSGKGAYVYAEASFSSEQILTIKVGGQGMSSDKGPNRGGWPDGGNSGEDIGTFEWEFDASGGGGGSTSLYLGDTKLLIAGAGAGGIMNMNGCPGGEFEKHYCPQSNNNNCYQRSESIKGNSNGIGGDGKDDDVVPGSGGGGGNYGGIGGETAYSDAYDGMACSGSSYMNPYYNFTNYGSEADQREGNGLLQITPLVECLPECAMCNSSTECSSCPINKYLKEGHCFDSCGFGFYSYNGECLMCSSECKTCYGDPNFCTSCKNPYNKAINGSCTKSTKVPLHLKKQHKMPHFRSIVMIK